MAVPTPEFMENLMSMVREISMNPAAEQAFLQEVGMAPKDRGRVRTKDEILQMHESGMKKAVEAMNQHHFYINPGDVPRKPAAVRAPTADLDAYTPILIKDLSVDTTHRGRVLRGVLIVDPLAMTGVHSVLEDEKGDVVRVSFYDALPVPDSEHMLTKLREANRMFPKGIRLAVIEPYYKMSGDGGHGVRVDDMDEVVFLQEIGPQDIAGWQKEGGKHFKAQQFEDAIRCYSQALRLLEQGTMSDSKSDSKDSTPTPPSSSIITSILLNLSFTHIKLHQPLPALQYAAAATAINQSNSKAHYRLAKALDALSHMEAAQKLPRTPGPELTQSEAACIIMWEAANEAKLDAPSRDGWLQELFAVRNSTLPGRTKRLFAAGKGVPKADVQKARVAMLRCLSSKLQVDESFGPGAGEGNGPSASSKAAGNGGSGTTSAAKRIEYEACFDHSTAHKQWGNQLFKEGEYLDALSAYQEALAALRPLPTAVLLSNRAACHLRTQRDQLPLALLDATVAVLLDPQQVKAHYRRVEALLQLAWFPEADAACQLALTWHPTEPALRQLQKRIQTAHNPSVPAPINNTATSSSNSAPSADSATVRKAPGNPGGMAGGSSTGSSTNGGGGLGTTGGSNAAGSSGSGESKRGAGGGQQPPEAPKGKAGKKKVEPITQKKFKELEDKASADVEAVAMANMMHEMLPPEMKAQARRVQGYLDERVPPFHEEFSREGRWPALVDTAKCYRLLWRAYELARGFNRTAISLMTSPDKISQFDLMKRMGHPTKKRLEWLLSAPVGDVNFQPRQGYASGLCHSFGNVPPGKEIVNPGTTHVSVGFVDLGGLAWSCTWWGNEQARPGHIPASLRTSAHPKMLRWVGYEKSVYAVAKTLVVAEMLMSGADVDHVLQVWFSSAWSTASLSSFRTALTALLSRHTTRQQQPAAVMDLLRHWQVHNVTLSESREQWIESVTSSNAFIGNFIEKADRMAVCSYLITGQLLDAEVGSTVMFGIPAGVGERAMDENFLQTFQAEDLFRHRIEGSMRNIIEAGISLLRQQISRLRQLMVDRLIIVEVRLGEVTPTSTSILDEIRAMKPYTMSWSNVPDFIEPKAFHRMARHCSAPSDTVHYMNSMNWIFDVKGASQLEYMFTMKSNIEKLRQVIQGMLEIGKTSMKALYYAFGWQKIVLVPPVENDRNLLEYTLYVQQHEAYVRAFFKDERINDQSKQVVVTYPPQYDVLRRATSTMFITFTYDDTINFTMGPNGF